MQAAGPYTGKGTLADEAEMDMVSVKAYVADATTIQCFWQAPQAVIGNFKFNYIK
jgi:D-alanine-D-alanine ligase-like ATP-grasp enzyme